MNQKQNFNRNKSQLRKEKYNMYIIHTAVMSRVDYRNALLCGITDSRKFKSTCMLLA